MKTVSKTIDENQLFFEIFLRFFFQDEKREERVLNETAKMGRHKMIR